MKWGKKLITIATEEIVWLHLTPRSLNYSNGFYWSANYWMVVCESYISLSQGNILPRVWNVFILVALTELWISCYLEQLSLMLDNFTCPVLLFVVFGFDFVLRLHSVVLRAFSWLCTQGSFLGSKLQAHVFFWACMSLTSFFAYLFPLSRTLCSFSTLWSYIFLPTHISK